MSLRRALLVVLALVLAFGTFGCIVKDPGPEEDGPPLSEAHNEAEEAVEKIDWSHMNGRWASETTLVDIDNEEYSFLGDQPGAQWECSVDGAVMSMQTAENLYTGILKPRGDTQWVYEGMAEYTDEDGVTWRSTMLINGVQQDDDHFSGEFEASIDSDTDGHLYTARWEFTAERME